MVDTMLAGNGTLGSFTPVQLRAGEQDFVTDRARVKIGQVLEQHTVIAFDGDGLIVAWDPDASGIGAEYAKGTVTFSTAVPVGDDTVTINGVVFTFKAANPDADENEVLIGGTLNATAANLAAAINARNEANPEVMEVSAKANAAVVTVRANVPGADGNAITLAKNAATPANVTVSGGTLASGASSEGTAGGVLLHAIDTSPAGLNKEVFAPYISGGFLNHEALVWPDGVEGLPARRAAFAGTNISIGSVL